MSTDNKKTETEQCTIPSITHRCILVKYGDVEKRCVKCNYITWVSEGKKDSEIIEDMVNAGYPLPNCSNGG